MKFLSSFPHRRILPGLFGAIALAGMVQTAPAADKPTIPIIVKDTTSFFWQIVFAGARKAGKDLEVNVPQLGAQSESDINGQIGILENAVSEKSGSRCYRADPIRRVGQADRRGSQEGQSHRY